MERILFVWDELDDWAGIARHYLASMANSLPIAGLPSEAATVILCLPFLFG